MPKVLYEIKTQHHQVKVVEENSIRKLLFGEGLSKEQSGIDINNLYLHVFDYSLLSMHSLLFSTTPSSILVIGLGGGVIPREISRFVPESNIDIIEIDEEVYKIAKEYFYFEDSEKVNVHIGDAFSIVKTLSKKYDIIIADAFCGGYIPFHLMSDNFIKSLYSIMNEKSVIAFNMCNWHMSFFSQLNTVCSVFGYDNIYQLRGRRNKYTSIIFASKGNLSPADSFNVSSQSFPTLEPLKYQISMAVRNSKIFHV